MTTSRLFDQMLCLLSAFVLGLLTGLTSKYYQKAAAGDIESQQITTMLAFVSLAQAYEVARQLWRLSPASSDQTETLKTTGRWRRDDLSIMVVPRTIGVAFRVPEEGEVTAALRREFLPENGGVRLPSPYETVYHGGMDDEDENSADDEYDPGCLYCDDEESVTGDDDESEMGEDDSNTSLDEDDNPSRFWAQESEASLQEVKRGYVVLHSGTVEVIPCSAVLEDPAASPMASRLDGRLNWMDAGFDANVDSDPSRAAYAAECRSCSWV
jgi:hypothetical protein